ncbi:MAG: nickel-dependent hydrogenase large subunit [Candidatus Thiodiazotropha lotti]|uniref:Uptake hydrogenase large subunit n=1 Tax=Candidatus Thiodiazotropha endoloripes TaxID=1818881 RepID=A0A1E2UU98_9GAMM|nr:nickel-dependent hydrogenase large subunit [Candidatus Thiodiazotropha endoloripes]MCG7899970.1 nickel-dependent hydrogenase large subunit [Candidatus Thiodiazotropha weberae]MCG7993217.1 nickel-dependent hydrogenase large subunit [Candidatus Thiodiazotropha lotti]MCG7904049.1 nickel-dependent hydrogenase large subunit [Candidatus Thiodiazotropha weberae]MCG7915381.1 nickel-dependent hydrogenase large subunit [Candidatus Thiodiazotropha weberae]MCG8001647.1 nickel-dependent hydrogenase larg
MSTKTTPNGFKLDDSGQRVVVDPVTRIEGHMRCEVNLDEENVIRNAVSTGTMWRGLEVILKGRDPRDAWAFTQRICGVCTGTHALTSVRAVEDALKIEIPDNANSIRNIMQLTLQVHDHLVHFYHLHALDWVNPVNALKADPKATSELQQKVSPKHAKSSPGYFRDIQNRLKKFVESGQLGPFKNGYWDNPAYLLPPEADLMAVTHYLEALDFQKEIMKIRTILGGKDPHPNWLVGGVPCPINLDGVGSVGALNMVNLNQISHIIDSSREFIKNVYIPDLLAVAQFYKGWLYGGGLASTNVLSYGDIPDRANDYTTANLMMPRGAIINGNLKEVHEVDLRNPEEIQEYVPHSWYNYPSGVKGLHPWDGVTEPNYELGPNAKGTKTNIEQIDENAKYSWIKAPRWRGHPMEVGPLARYIVGYASGHEEITEQINFVLKTLDVPVTALFSTLGRTAARGLEADWAADKMRYFMDKLIANIKAGDSSTANVDNWDPETWPREAKGVGFSEAPRGALGHWIKIKDTRIDNYQCVVPTTWNGSPRDSEGNIGAFEASLMNTKVARAEEPVEILRTLHSFDPCLACSTHVMSEEGKELAKVKVR